jgi:molecular chaperone DnaK
VTVAPKLLPLRIRLPYGTEEEFIEKYGSNVARGGVFIATRALKEEGTALAFEFVLADGTRLLRGEGVVVKAQVDEGGGRSGMTVRFVKLDAPTKAFIDRLIARRNGEPAPATPPEGSSAREEAPAQAVAPVTPSPLPPAPPAPVERRPASPVTTSTPAVTPPSTPGPVPVLRLLAGPPDTSGTGLRRSRSTPHPAPRAQSSDAADVDGCPIVRATPEGGAATEAASGSSGARQATGDSARVIGRANPPVRASPGDPRPSKAGSHSSTSRASTSRASTYRRASGRARARCHLRTARAARAGGARRPRAPPGDASH